MYLNVKIDLKCCFFPVERKDCMITLGQLKGCRYFYLSHCCSDSQVLKILIKKRYDTSTMRDAEKQIIRDEIRNDAEIVHCMFTTKRIINAEFMHYIRTKLVPISPFFILVHITCSFRKCPDISRGNIGNIFTKTSFQRLFLTYRDKKDVCIYVKYIF